MVEAYLIENYTAIAVGYGGGERERDADRYVYYILYQLLGHQTWQNQTRARLYFAGGEDN